MASGTPASGPRSLAGGAAAVDVGGDVERVVADVEEGVDVAVDRRDAVEVRLRRLDARDLAGGELVGERGGAQLREIGHVGLLTAPPRGSRSRGIGRPRHPVRSAAPARA